MIRLIAAVFLAAVVSAQQPAPSDVQFADRLSQLMESTAVAVPGLVPASEPVRRLASATLTAMRAAEQDPVLKYRFSKQVAAYLALSDSFPRPEPFPATAEQQFSELRDGLHRLEIRFEGSLEAANRTARSREADPTNSARYADANSKLLPAGTGPRVVFLGDSITDLWRLNEYFTGRDFINRGIGGQTTLQMLGRFLQDVVALKPKAVVILAGINDIARDIKPGAIEDNLALMGESAKINGIKPVFASILPVSDYHKGTDPRYEVTKARSPAAIRQVNSWMREYCRRENFTYLDYYTAIADGTGQIPADMADDGLHPNAKGYRAMAPLALDAVNRALSVSAPAVPEKSQKRHFGLLGK